jgi:hypothetical protein
MKVVNNRIAAVALGATIVVGIGATGATAARLITSGDIKNETITTLDVRNGSLTGHDLRDGSIVLSDLSSRARANLNPTGTGGVKVATLDGTTAIADIGGPINANSTDLDTGVTLPAGTYLVTVDGSFESDTAAAPDSADVYPQLSLWIDANGDDSFSWQNGEGDISPNALMPTAAKRHISVSGSTVVTLTKSTYVGLRAFGYDSNQGSARSGEIDVIDATITATPLR